jgi:hypothetical protein
MRSMYQYYGQDFRNFNLIRALQYFEHLLTDLPLEILR